MQPTEDGCTYGIYRLKLGKLENDSKSNSELENESKLLLAQHREGHMKINKIEITVLKVDVTHYINVLTLKNTQNLKLVITHQSYGAV